MGLDACSGAQCELVKAGAQKFYAARFGASEDLFQAIVVRRGIIAALDLLSAMLGVLPDH